MSTVKIGWIHIDESFESNGDIDLVVCDKRTGEMLAFTIETLEEYDEFINFIDNNRAVGSLQKLAVASK